MLKGLEIRFLVRQQNQLEPFGWTGRTPRVTQLYIIVSVLLNSINPHGMELKSKEETLELGEHTSDKQNSAAHGRDEDYF